MRAVTQGFRQRHWLLFAVLSVLLHVLALQGVTGALGVSETPLTATPAPIVAQLRLAPAPAAAPAAPPQAAPAPRPQASRPAPAPLHEPEAQPVAEAPAPEPAPAAVAEQTRAPEPAPALSSESKAEAPAAQGDVGSAPRFKVSLPPSADIVLDVTRKDADGSLWHGAGAIAWRVDGERYRMVLEATVRIIVRLSLLEVTSEGRLTEAGLAPQTSSEKRRGRARTAIHFDHEGKQISFSASEQREALIDGAQDKASLLMQLAGIARADPQQLARAIDIQVGEERAATLYRFTFVGEEELDTAMGKLRTWHLVRLPRPGAYNARLDIWLAPDQYGYPVQIRNTEANGAVTTQTVTKVTLNEAGPT